MNGLIQQVPQVPQAQPTEDQWELISQVIQRQEEKLNIILSQFTIASHEQNMLRQAARERVEALLRGMGSEVYHKYARSYYFSLVE